MFWDWTPVEPFSLPGLPLVSAKIAFYLFAPSIADAEVAMYKGDRVYDVAAQLTEGSSKLKKMWRLGHWKSRPA
jgi:hypothetical protein